MIYIKDIMMNRKNFFCLLMTLLAVFYSNAQNNGYEIKIKLENYESQKLKLGFHYGNKQYIKDSATINNDGFFIFKGDTELAPGIYLVIFQPKSTYFEILINRGEQHFLVTADALDVVNGVKFKGSPENELYYDYLEKLSDKRSAKDKWKEQLKTDTLNQAKIKEKIAKLDAEVDALQKELMTKKANTFTAMIIKATRDVDVPKLEADTEEARNKRYFWYKQHFFDNIKMDDERMVRTPLLYNRVDYYMNKLVVQDPDTLIEAVDRVLSLVKPVDDAFKLFCTNFLNQYAKSEYIGQDAIYVHLALKYYNVPGMTPWVDKANIEKIVDNAKSLEPTLLGKKAMDFDLTTREGKRVNLYSIKADYTVVAFWAPDCGHCQKEMPFLISFWEKWKSKGVELISICNRYTPDKLPECWKFLDERPGMQFTTGVDLYMQSNTQANYWVKTTPMIYILDKDKKILMKKIKGEALEEVMQEVINVETAKAEAKKTK
jgi:thiol-disulfide isomerase/thioredoxin